MTSKTSPHGNPHGTPPANPHANLTTAPPPE